MPCVPTVAADTNVDTVAQHLLADGCVIVERLASEEDLQAIETDLSTELAITDTNNTEFAGQHTKRFNLEPAVGRRSRCVQARAWQGARRRNSELLQRVATPPGACRCVHWAA